MTETLIATETLDTGRSLSELETVVEQGQQTFTQVGLALMEIRDRNLHHDAGYKNFDTYCQERWGFSRSRSTQLIDAAEVTTVVVTLGLPAPANEAQAREIAKAPPEDQPSAWKEAVETAPDGKVTAAHVGKVVASKTTDEQRAQRQARASQKAQERRDAEEQRRKEQTHTLPLPDGIPIPIPADVSVVWDDERDWERLTPCTRYQAAAAAGLGELAIYREPFGWSQIIWDAKDAELTDDQAATLAVYVATAKACLDAADALLEKSFEQDA